MKRIISFFFLISSLVATSQNRYASDWQQVDSLSNLGQPQTALEIVNHIYNETKATGLTSQFVKATIYRMKLEADFQEDFYKTAIERTKSEIQQAKAPEKQILSSVLAELYWRYFQNNRWNILNRSETAGFLPNDMTTWDARKLVSACMENYALSLTVKDILKKTAISSFSEILIKQDDSEKFRPTLFDFLAHRAIDFYSSNDAGLTRPANTFSMNSADFLKTFSGFGALTLISPDDFSFEFQALRLYQEVVNLHLNDTDPTALIDADLERLSFVHEKSSLPEKDSLYLAELEQMETRYKNHSSSTEISYKIAFQLNNEDEAIEPYSDETTENQSISSSKKWNKKRAVEICKSAINRFSESFGAKNCRSLLENIQQPSLSITASNAILVGKPSLALVSYRNVQKVYFRIIKTEPELLLNNEDEQSANKLKQLRQMKPVASWEQVLPDDGDYREHSAEVKIPALSPGHYTLLASNDTTFPDSLAVVVSTSFWCSNISYITRDDQVTREVLVLHLENGQPLEGVGVQLLFREYFPKTRKMGNTAGEKYFTDKNGIVSFNPKNKEGQYLNYALEFTMKGDRLLTEDYFSSYYYQKQESPTITQTHFFTDRSIYRPGQTIFFKGIVLERKTDDVKIKPKFKTEVTLYDTNGQVVSKQNLTTNDFGSFAGSFTAPQNVLTGEMSIRCETGYTSVRVEEYKRPKFEVTFDPVKGSYRLGEMITVKGKEMAYAGSSVSEAKVRYRVVRRVNFPYFWGNWRYMSRPAEMEIINGEAVTNSDGSFSITFKAIPDASINLSTNPMFSYTVYADVADLNGESHSAETAVSVGEKALLINTDLQEEVNLEKGFQFSLSTTNLNGEKENAIGTITISKLRKPSQVQYSRKWQRPDRFTMTKSEFEKVFPGEVYDKEDDATTWPIEDIAFSANFATPQDSLIKQKNNLQAGMYRIEIKTKDAFGEEVLYQKQFSAFQPQNTKTERVSPFSITLLTPITEPGQDALLLIGTPVKKASIVYEIVHKNEVVSREIFSINNEQKLIRIPVKEEYRGNFSVNLTMVKNNRLFAKSKLITVPYTNKKLDIQFATFRNKLLPGQDEEWQITLRDSKGEKAAGELLASMYDASLDAFIPHGWTFNVFNSYYGRRPWNDHQCFASNTSDQFYYPEIEFRTREHLYDQLYWFGFGNGYPGRRIGGMISIRGAKMEKSGKAARFMEVSAPMMVMEEESKLMISDEQVASVVKYTAPVVVDEIKDNEGIIAKKPAEPQSIQIRKNLNETAFFYPQLATNENGEIVLKFKATEALTRWKMMGLAYTKDLKYGQIEKTLVTQKDLMVFTNAPRFMREGDSMEFAAKVSNISDRNLSGTAELHFFDAMTMKPIDNLLGLSQATVPFSADKGKSAFVSWKISIPEGLQAVTYRITATAGDFSDGEEAAIPVLTNRMLVTESMPLPVNGMQQKKFNFDKLVNSGAVGSTLKNYRLSLEYTSNPAWYAVQALPYLMEYPYECAEQLFSRYYANSLATHIANSDPKIKRVFESWKNSSPDAMKSNLEKNEELKSVLLQESPWVREANNERERKQRIALLFDLNRMASEQNQALKKLRDMQNPNGGWPWFAGMPESRYITQHIVTGLGHMQNMKAFDLNENSETAQMLEKAIGYLDETLKEEFEKIKKDDKDYLMNNHLGYDDIQYLYARTYFNAEYPLGEEYSEMLGYYKAQSEKYWNTQNNYMKAMMALYLNRLSNEKTASLIMRSLKETALHSEEMGMYWRNELRGWFWHQAPVETQALLIEAFDEVSHDLKSVEEMKIWLLKQKQTQDWKTTKATTEAVYALLLRGSSLLASDKQVEITVGNEKVDPYKQDGPKPEAGTGYFKTSWDASAIKPEMGNVTVINPNPTVAWGAMYWQYFEQLDRITPAQTPLSLNKKLFRKVNTPTGPVIEPITANSTIKVGDKIVVRVELRTDRDMEYIHLKDMRASAFGPVNVLSGYRWQDGIGYYESTRDASTNFFISWLPKGTYIFEYKLVATQKGEFSNGITSVQSMYAPEFAAHSEGIRVKVQ